MRCVGLYYMPGSWLCAPCVAIPVHVIRYIIGKRLLNNRTDTRWGGWTSRRGKPCTTYRRARATSEAGTTDGCAGRSMRHREQQPEEGKEEEEEARAPTALSGKKSRRTSYGAV